jgi:hypothetical protein
MNTTHRNPSSLFRLKAFVLALLTLFGLSASTLWAESVYFSTVKVGGALRTGLNENGHTFATSSGHTTASGAIGASCRYKGTTAADTAKDTITWPGSSDGDNSLPPTIAYGVYTLKHSKGSSSTDNNTTTYTISADSNCRYQSDGKVAKAFGSANANPNTWQQLGVLVLDSTPHAPVFSVNFTIPAESGMRLQVDNFQLSSIGLAVHIGTQPPATASVAENYSGAICTVGAGGTTGATYTWKRNGDAISGGAYASYYSGYNGATLNALSIPASETGVSLTCTVGGTYAQSDNTATVDSQACVLTVGTADPCTTVADVGGITHSPLAPAGYIYSDAATITCTGCSGSATAVTIKDTTAGYATVGTATGGSSTVIVTVTGTLTSGHVLCAVQTVGGQDSCLVTAPTVTVGNLGCTYVAGGLSIPITGPIQAGDTTVTVAGVSASAEDVTVYADGTQIGQNTSPGGLTTVTVTTSALVKGKHLTATQKLSGTEGCIPGSSGAPLVGGGNAALSVVLEFTVGGTSYLWLGANNRLGGFGSAPTGVSATVTPGAGWQTVTLTPGTSHSWNWGTALAYTFPTTGNGTLQYIWFTPSANTEMGPYSIYIDTIENGTTSVFDWESNFAPGNSDFMQVPHYATTPAIPLHDGDTTWCVNTNADMGANCQRMDWEFVNDGVPNTIRGVLKTDKTIDLSKPISLRILVLPAGTTTPALTVSQPAGFALTQGTPANVAVTAADHSGGTSTITYQWKQNGVDITAANAGDRTGYDTATLNFTTPVCGDAGNYTLAVTNVVTGVNAGTYYKVIAPIAVTWTPVSQTITFGALADKAYGDDDFTVSATASSLLGVTFTSSDTATATVTSGGLVHILRGSHNTLIQAHQGGDCTYGAATEVDQVLNVNPGISTTTVGSSQNPSAVDAPVTFTATVAYGGTGHNASTLPTGSVEWYIDSVDQGPATLDGSGHATLGPITTLTAGTHTVRADYAGDGNYDLSTGSLAGGQTVASSSGPCSALSTNLAIVDLNDGYKSIRLDFQGTPNAIYYVVASSDVTTGMGSWNALPWSTNTAAAGTGLWSCTVTNSATQQVYRAKAVNPCP